MDTTTALAYDMPTSRAPAILQFNKLSGEFLNAFRTPDNDISTLGGHDFFTFVVDDYSLTEDIIVGKYPDYKVVSQKDLPTKMFEETMDIQVQNKITKRYKLVDQVNIISAAILKIAEVTGVELPELTEMRDYIDEVKRANKVRRDFYKESPDYEYISIEDEVSRLEGQLDGGVHELFGPQQISPGRVF